jgi:hypothetical protein
LVCCNALALVLRCHVHDLVSGPIVRFHPTSRNPRARFDARQPHSIKRAQRARDRLIQRNFRLGRRPWSSASWTAEATTFRCAIGESGSPRKPDTWVLGEGVVLATPGAHPAPSLVLSNQNQLNKLYNLQSRVVDPAWRRTACHLLAALRDERLLFYSRPELVRH